MCSHPCTLQLFCHENKFIDNLAREGGRIHAAANSNLDFDGMNIFDMNKAIDNGGGIYLSKTNLMFGGISKFAKNSAREGRGG